jgi:hypothetical protein
LLFSALLTAALSVGAATSVAASDADGESVELLDWSALVPEGWQPSVPDMSSFFHDPSAPAGAQSGFDAPTVETLQNKRVALEGWLVPLEIERAERYHEFLLVPYFGACYHVPPPPANQIVHLFVEDGVPHEELWEPQRVTGRMRIEPLVTDLAAAAYRMEDATAKVAQW